LAFGTLIQLKLKEKEKDISLWEVKKPENKRKDMNDVGTYQWISV